MTTTAAATTALPAVRWCDDPECGSTGKCAAIPARPLKVIPLFVAPEVSPAPEEILRFLSGMAATDGCEDDAGTFRMLPLGAQFTVHRAPDGDDGTRYYDAVYSGPAPDLAGLLTGMPEWTPELSVERARAVRFNG